MDGEEGKEEEGKEEEGRERGKDRQTNRQIKKIKFTAATFPTYIIYTPLPILFISQSRILNELLII